MSWLLKFLTPLAAVLFVAGNPSGILSADLPTGVVASFTTPDESGLSQVAARSPEQILFGSARGTLWQWNFRKGITTEQHPSARIAGPISHLQWDENGQLFAGSGLHMRIRSGQGEFQEIQLPRLTQMAVSPTGGQIAGVADEPPIVFLDPKTGKPTHRVDRQVWVDEMQYSPMGEFLATSRFGRVYLWKSATGELAWKSRLEGNIKGFAFSPDQSTIFASMAREGLWVIDAATGNIRNRYGRNHRDVDEVAPHRLAFSPDGMLLADTPMANRIEIWETFTGRPILLLGKHPGNITGMTFLPKGRRLVSVDDLGHAYLWDLSAPEFAAPFDVSKRYSDEQLGQLWGMLGELRGQSIWTAFVALSHRPEQTLALIDAPPNDDLLIQELIDRLDNDQFMVRQAAYRALRQLSLKAEPFLRKTLSTSGSAEAKVRIRRLLGYLAGPHREAQLRLMKESQNHRQMRVVQLLKWIGTSEAIERLETLQKSSDIAAVRKQAAMAIRELNGDLFPDN